MKVEKILEVRLDINDANNMFVQDYDKVFLEILKQKYKKRCYKSMLIIDIIKIIKRSKIYCKSKTLDGTLYVDIQFLASGIVYEQEEIIHKCKIIQIHSNGVMHAKSEYAAIQIANIDGMNIFKENEEIPVVVNRVKYNIFEDEITVLAFPLIPLKKKIILYKSINTSQSLNDIDEESNKILHEISELLKEMDKYKKDYKESYEFFINLLYPTKKPMNIKTEKKKIDAELFKKMEGKIITNSYSYLLDDFIYILDEKSYKSIIPDIQIIEVPFNELILRILYDYKKNIIMLKDFILTYNTKDKIKDNSHIWSVFNMLKH